MSEEFDYSYVPSENENPEKDGHIYMYECMCDTCKLEVMATNFLGKTCPKCNSSCWIGMDGGDGFWLDKNEVLGDVVIINNMLHPEN